MKKFNLGVVLLAMALVITGAAYEYTAVTTSVIQDGAVTSAKIADGTIVNADVNASAAVAYTKLDLATINEQKKNMLAGDLSGVLTACKGMWLMSGTTTTLDDEFSTNYDGTLSGGLTLATDQGYKGFAFDITMNGSTDYSDFGDRADFSFDDSSAEAVSWIFLLNTTNAGTVVVASKWDTESGSEDREWMILSNSDETLGLFCYDESANIQVSRATDAALSVGWNFVVITYDGSGGATAMNGATIYVNGVAVASTATNNGSYVAMEAGGTSMFLGARDGNGAVDLFWPSDMAVFALEKSALSAAEVWQLWKLVEGVYNL